MSVFAERLKLLREARNITQARLAELLEGKRRTNYTLTKAYIFS